MLLIGGTGYIGKFIAEASVRSGHRTFALVRDTAPSDPSKSQIVQKLKELGVALIKVIKLLLLFICKAFLLCDLRKRGYFIYIPVKS